MHPAEGLRLLTTGYAAALERGTRHRRVRHRLAERRRRTSAAATGAESGQMAGIISSPGSSGSLGEQSGQFAGTAS